jgi:hypothetical protein
MWGIAYMISKIGKALLNPPAINPYRMCTKVILFSRMLENADGNNKIPAPNTIQNVSVNGGIPLFCATLPIDNIIAISIPTLINKNNDRKRLMIIKAYKSIIRY